MMWERIGAMHFSTKSAPALQVRAAFVAKRAYFVRRPPTAAGTVQTSSGDVTSSLEVHRVQCAPVPAWNYATGFGAELATWSLAVQWSSGCCSSGSG